MKNPYIEGLKEMGRIVLIAILPMAIVMVENGSVDFKALGILALVTLLKGVDKYIHENPEIDSKGLLPF